MKKVLRLFTLVFFIGFFCFAAYKIGSYYWEMYRSKQAVKAAEQYVSAPEMQGMDECITVDFDALRSENSDIAAWLYAKDTPFNYPVVQGSDNEYYLHRLLDGSYNSNGTLFIDYRCAPALGSKNTIIYGHNMKSGNMFGQLTKYRSQDFYDAHPTMYLITPEASYRLELFAGLTVESDAEIYQPEPSREYLQQCIKNSSFHSDVTLPDGPIVTLSTCAYEYENARYVVLAAAVPIN